MIESIQIADIATYGKTPEALSGLSKLNFLFGPNGSGKTTLTRVIANESNYPTCKVIWKGGTKLQPIVYNRDFVETNFNSCRELKGIFTLGEKDIGTLEKIDAAKRKYDELIKEIEKLNLSLQGNDGLGGKKGELTALEAEFKDTCWAQKQKHDDKLKGAFEGYRNSAEKFKNKILEELNSNSATLDLLSDLEKKAETIFESNPTTETTIPDVDTKKIIKHESDAILKKRVIGKEDVDIAAMIQKLGNSDWVKEGIVYYKKNDKICPFCQQNTSEAFAKSLNEYFDETFEKDSKAINELGSNYKIDSGNLQKEINLIITAPSKFLDIEKMKSAKSQLDSKISLNIQHIATKKKEPSQSISLESLVTVISEIKTLIDNANILVSQHNKMVANLVKERSDLTSQVWKYLLEKELKASITSYKTKRDNLNKAIESFKKQIETAIKESMSKKEEIKSLEKEVTSIQPTIDGINDILKAFGFQSFTLAKAENGICYKIVRKDGSDAKETLSEGERAFVTFLYFYYLLKGSDSESGMTIDRIVVFDDPVSSFDSDILFIVASLIKDLFDEVRKGSGHIKQIFVLTHNVYFHKEITFNPRRDKKGKAKKDETFWLIRRPGLTSKIEKHDTNPIKTSYELLWSELRKPDPSNLTIQNTMRRILENYFTILGGVDTDSICAKFEGTDKLVCKSLFSWVHAGSHYAMDDIYVSIGDAAMQTYLKVFMTIFEKEGHLAHYKMMMGEEYTETAPS